ncbi:MAG TPA: Uma2 family endonuclease [Candidatus Limnocylindrales bacterium]|nr:Uma2 family endonuclease [Candidatus Limnocylindrales bacterium]
METTTSDDGRYTVEKYFALVEEGVLDPDERTELLHGIVVSSAPPTPAQASGMRRAISALRRAVGPDIPIASRSPLVASPFCVPEPDVAILPGQLRDYDTQHPTTALLVVHVSDRSLPQDRLTRTPIYARAGVANYWIVNLRNHTVEWFGEPDSMTHEYRAQGIAGGSDRLPMDAFPDAVVTAAELLPSH